MPDFKVNYENKLKDVLEYLDGNASQAAIITTTIAIRKNPVAYHLWSIIKRWQHKNNTLHRNAGCIS